MKKFSPESFQKTSAPSQALLLSSLVSSTIETRMHRLAREIRFLPAWEVEWRVRSSLEQSRILLEPFRSMSLSRIYLTTFEHFDVIDSETLSLLLSLTEKIQEKLPPLWKNTANSESPS